MLKKLSLSVLMVCSIAGFGCSTSTPILTDSKNLHQAPRMELPSIYRVGVGDILQINVLEFPELAGNYTVRPDGKITLPLIDDISVADRSTDEIVAELRQAYLVYILDPKITVIVQQANNIEFTRHVKVAGAVQRPYSEQYRPGMTVLDAVLHAGGATEVASKNSTTIHRKRVDGYEVYAVNLGDILAGTDMSTNYYLHPGDVVAVPESSVPIIKTLTLGGLLGLMVPFAR